MINLNELYEVKSFIEQGHTFHLFTQEDVNNWTEALEALELETMVTIEEGHNGNVYGISATVKTYVTVEDYTEEGEGFDVVLNTYEYDTNGKELDYTDKLLKNFKTVNAATKFAQAQGYKVKFL